MENIYNYTKSIDVSRVKLAVYPLYFTGNIDVSTAHNSKEQGLCHHKNLELEKAPQECGGSPLSCPRLK